MQSKLFLIVTLLLSATIYSCHKEESINCITPNRAMIQGSWKQDFSNKDAFQPPPEWEKIEFRQDSFFMRIRVRTDMLSDTNCRQSTWLEYTKGVYNVDSSKIFSKGIFTDSNYVIKAGGCHSSGKYQTVFGISLCSTILTLNVLLQSSSIPKERLEIRMYR